MKLSPQEQVRYTRQLMLPEIGVEGQLRLKQSSVLVIGAGGLGSPAIYYLASAGVGHIGIADGDAVELSNLNRQILHASTRIGKNKACSAAETIQEWNPEVQVSVIPEFLQDENILPLIRQYDFVVDASDQLQNKFLINDACVTAGVPFCHGGIEGWDGQVMTYLPKQNLPCYRCVFESLPADQESKPIGVIGVTAGIIGTIQASEAIRYLLGEQDGLLKGTLLRFSGQTMQFRKIPLGKCAPHCPVCHSVPDANPLQWYQKFRNHKK